MSLVQGKQIAPGTIEASNVDPTQIPTLAGVNVFTGIVTVPYPAPSSLGTLAVPKSYVDNSSSQPSTANKDMAANTTTSLNTLACSTALAATPAGSGYIEVTVNGVLVDLAGDKNGWCYFSGDGGTTARVLGAAVGGDFLYWSHSGGLPIADYELDTTDSISFNYNVVP